MVATLSLLSLPDLCLPACSGAASWVGDFGSRLLQRGKYYYKRGEEKETDLGNVPYMELGLLLLLLVLLLAGFFCLTETALRLGTSVSSRLLPSSLSWWDSEVRASMEPV